MLLIIDQGESIMITTIDLFAGCGGFSCGFEKAGFKITSAVEFDKTIAESYQANHKDVNMIADDIKNVDNSNTFVVILFGITLMNFSCSVI